MICCCEWVTFIHWFWFKMRIDTVQLNKIKWWRDIMSNNWSETIAFCRLFFFFVLSWSKKGFSDGEPEPELRDVRRISGHTHVEGVTSTAVFTGEWIIILIKQIRKTHYLGKWTINKQVLTNTHTGRKKKRYWLTLDFSFFWTRLHYCEFHCQYGLLSNKVKINRG